MNITSRCAAACVFCAKFEHGWDYRGAPLKLAADPSVREIVAAAGPLLDASPRAEAVFCGYGEPTLRMDAVLATAAALRARRPSLRLRVNTLGLGSAAAGRDITGELARSVEAVSVSLNTADPRHWRALHRPRPDLAEGGFEAALAFILACLKACLETTVTAVAQPGVDVLRVEVLARSLGARFRLRPLFSA